MYVLHKCTNASNALRLNSLLSFWTMAPCPSTHSAQLHSHVCMSIYHSWTMAVARRPFILWYEIYPMLIAFLLRSFIHSPSTAIHTCRTRGRLSSSTRWRRFSVHKCDSSIITHVISLSYFCYVMLNHSIHSYYSIVYGREIHHFAAPQTNSNDTKFVDVGRIHVKEFKCFYFSRFSFQSLSYKR